MTERIVMTSYFMEVKCFTYMPTVQSIKYVLSTALSIEVFLRGASGGPVAARQAWARGLSPKNVA